MVRPQGTAPQPRDIRLKPKSVVERQIEAVRGPIEDDDNFHKEQLALKRKNNNMQKSAKRLKNKDPGRSIRLDLKSEENNIIAESDDKIEEKIAFCCHICHCPQHVKDKYLKDEYVQASSGGLYHRRCCHRTPTGEIPEDWIPDILHAMKGYEDILTGEEFPCSSTSEVDVETNGCDVARKTLTIKATETNERRYSVIKAYQKYQTNKKQENEMRNLDEKPLLVDELRQTEETYRSIEKRFKDRLQEETGQEQPGAVVLDLFGGIGAGVVCLKRLKIEISMIVHVEHCQVANAVYKHSHCRPENQAEIRHEFIRRFEDFEMRLDDHANFKSEYGGPPCVDYTQINAKRKGSAGVQGSYLPRTAKIIEKVRQINLCCDRPDPLFLVENVILNNEADMSCVKKAFGKQAAWYPIDSRDFTPLRRNRLYISNIPLWNMDTLHDPPPSLCFDDGYDIAGQIFDPLLRHMKAPGLMASMGRLDDEPRMLIFKEWEEDTREIEFLARSPNVNEREKLMGFHPGYVYEPVKELYKKVFDGLCQGLFVDGEHWKEQVPKEYHLFAGDYHHFEGNFRPYEFHVDHQKGLQVKMAPPVPRKEEELETAVMGGPRKPEYYNEEQFAKRLLGNSFSVPTVEKLLKPITKLFAVRDYGQMFNYQFAWKDWKEENYQPPRRSERLEAYLQNHPEIRQSLKEIGSKPNAIEAARSRHVATQRPTKVSEAKMNQVSRRLLEDRDPLNSDEEDDSAWATVV